MYADLLAESSSMLEPPVECSTPCHDGFDGHVDSSILLSPCAPPCISNCIGTPDVAMVSGTWAVAAGGGGGGGDLCSGAPWNSGFSTHVPFLHLPHILSHVSHRGRRGRGRGVFGSPDHV